MKTVPMGGIRTEDLTEKKFGTLTVLKNAGTRGKKHERFWVCKCDCGKISMHQGNGLKAGHIRSCGCQRHKNKMTRPFFDLTGMKFGMLTALSVHHIGPAGHSYWLCKCDKCGKERVIRGSSLRQGLTKQCPCFNQYDLMGKTRNNWIVTARIPAPVTKPQAGVRWLIRCDKCGKERPCRGKTFVGGLLQACKHKGGNKKQVRYKVVSSPGHPNARKNGEIYEHVLVMTEHLKRPLTENEVVHHKNGQRRDNRLENLELRTIFAHGPGQNVSDMVEYCRDYLSRYAPHLLMKGRND